MASKRLSPNAPVCLHGKVVFDFFNNDDEDFKRRSLKSLAKEARKEFNISCLPFEEHQVENPESGALALSLCAANHQLGMEQMDRVLKFLDEKAPGRILREEIQEADIL